MLDIMLEKVFIVSGYVEKFVDFLVECKKCGVRFRVDYLVEEVFGIDIEGMSVEYFI